MRINKKTLVALIASIVVLGIIGFLAVRYSDNRPVNKHNSSSVQSSKPKAKTKPKSNSFNRQKHSLTQASSPWVIVNKHNSIDPQKYNPKLTVPDIPMRPNITYDEKHVASVMAPTLINMINTAKKDGLTINLQSGYRSYGFQVSLYNRYAANSGKAKADTFSARPGHSEHQTGLAADLGGVSTPSCNVAQCFADTAEGEWLAKNAYRYGFILRYPKDFDNITGYKYEPWHFRYVGKSLAYQMHKSGTKTLEKFFKLPAAPNYNNQN